VNTPEDKRLDLVEIDLRQLRSDHRTDFHWTWGGLITAFLITWAGIIGLALLSWNQFNDLHKEMQKLEVALAKIDARLERIEAKRP
jgi:hypothetical protein